MEPYDVIVNQPVVIDNVSLITIISLFNLINSQKICFYFHFHSQNVSNEPSHIVICRCLNNIQSNFKIIFAEINTLTFTLIIQGIFFISFTFS